MSRWSPKIENFTLLAELKNLCTHSFTFWCFQDASMSLCYSGWPEGIKLNYKHTFGSFCVHTVSCENNYCCGWLIGSESSSEADINGAAVIVTLLVMPHDSLGFRSYNCASPNLENKIPNRLIYLCYKLVLSKPSLKSYHFESLQPLGLAAVVCW